MSLAPTRVAARIAWRSARRNVRRSALVVAMVALPVTLATGAATAARTIVGSPQEDVTSTMGAADVMLTAGRRVDASRLSERLPPGSEALVLRTGHVGLVEDGELLFATVVEPDRGLGHPLLRGLYDRATGYPPDAPGEAAVNEKVLDMFDAGIGDHVRIGRHRLTITGTVRTRVLDSPVAVVGRGTLDRAGSSTVLIDLPPGTEAGAVTGRIRHQLVTRSEVAALAASDAFTWDAVSLVGGVLALFATGLIAAAAFVVGTRRRLRELGLVGAVGGAPRHVRAVVWFGGTTLGVVGGIVGSAAGVAGAALAHPLLERFAGRRIGGVAVNPAVIAVAVLLATIAATAAALGPSRAVAKLSTMAALAGQTAPPRRPGRFASLGVLVLLGGGALTSWGTVTREEEAIAAGLVAMLTGVLLSIPLLISLIGRVAAFLPPTARLAARDAGRHGRKTGAAVAAGVLALAAPIAVSAYSLSEEAFERRSPRLLENELLIGRWGRSVSDTTPREVAADFGQAFPGASIVPLAAVTRKTQDGRRDPVYAHVEAPGELGGEHDGAGATVVGWPLFAGDVKTLAALGAEGTNALTRGNAVVLGGYRPRGSVVRISVGTRTARVRATAIDSPAHFNEAIPKVVISHSTARRLDLETRIAHLLLADASPLTDEEIERGRAIAARHAGYYVNANDDYLPAYSAARGAATGASIPLALAVLAVAVALVTSESRRSHQILVAVGAGPLAHRKVVAASSGLLSSIAAVLAVPAGFLPTAVVQAANQAGRPVMIPWSTIAIVVLVVPVLSAAMSALATRTPRLGSLLTPAT